jgi:glycosyltransferase involved in cell wall biosynthesis
MPTVSVVVPNYNHARFLRQRIDSIFAQTYQDFELILLDDCSTDGSREILKEYARDPRVRLDFNEANSGSPYKQWNRGVRTAKGKYAWIAESDDYAAPDLLNRLVTVLERDAGVSFAYCRSRCVDEAGGVGAFIDAHLGYDVERWSSDFCEGGLDTCREQFLFHNPVANASAVVFRKSTYERIGGADEHLRYCGDWKLWAAMVLRGKLAYVCEPLNYYRFHAGTVRSKSHEEALHIVEPLEVVRSIVESGALRRSDVRNVRDAQAALWVPLVVSSKTPLRVKWIALKRAHALDPYAVHRVLRAGWTGIGLKVRRLWKEFTKRGTYASK